jgi:Phage integrase, N-terminal SAM-like domain
MTTNLRQRMTEDMQVRNLSLLTQSSYVQQVSMFARHFNKSPEVLGIEDIRNYQLYLTNQKGTAAKVGVRRQWRLAGMCRWLDGISVRIRNRAHRCRSRTELEAAGPRRVVTSAFADFCSSCGSPGNSPFLR